MREKLVVFHGKERCVNFCIRNDVSNSVSISKYIVLAAKETIGTENFAIYYIQRFWARCGHKKSQ